MKKLIIYLLFILFNLSTITYASDARFSWLPNKEVDLKGYKIYICSNIENCTNFTDVGLLEANNEGKIYYTLKNIPDTKTFYYATAYDGEGNESNPSNIIEYNPAPEKIKDFTLIKIDVSISIN